MQRKPIIAGNWKMYKTTKETEEYIKNLLPKIKEARADVYIAPSFLSISIAKKLVNDNIKIGAQNMHFEDEGAFTGEVSAKMLKDISVDFVILGHSERRQIFKEDDAFINKKVIKALKENIQPILCVGETQEQRDDKKTEETLERQVFLGLKDVSASSMKNVIIAYEPVWAIGTGKTATPEIAETAHLFIRKMLIKLYDKNIADSIHVLYGGSVKEANIEDLMQQHNIDGALIGGASLKTDSFSNIINKS